MICGVGSVTREWDLLSVAYATSRGSRRHLVASIPFSVSQDCPQSADQTNVLSDHNWLRRQ